jgi:hypothetical protein
MTNASPRPEDMRAALCDYVHALHGAYADCARLLPPGERAELPLLRASPFTVVVAASRNLHVLATTNPLPAPAGQEVQEADEADGLQWVVRFYDPVVLPELGVVDESDAPAPGEVRRVLGIADVMYHLTVTPGGGISAHHAQHAGTGLANRHAALARDGQQLRYLFRGREDLVDEVGVAERLGLHHAMRLLAGRLAGDDAGVGAAIRGDDDAALRRALLAAGRSAQPLEVRR